MNEEKTTLQKIADQKTEQMRVAIEQAIDDGAKIEELSSCTTLLECRYIDGLYLQRYTFDGTISVILKFSSEKIAKVFAPSKDELEKMAEKKREELEEIEKREREKWGD